MTPRTDKEAVAMCISDLLHSYRQEFGTDILMLSIIENTLAYIPDNYSLLLMKYEFYYKLAKEEFLSKDRDDNLLKSYESGYKAADKELAALHYEDVSQEWYEKKTVSTTTENRAIAEEMLEHRTKTVKEVRN